MEKFNKSRHARYLLNLHIVWISEYRKAVLGPYREALTDILHSIAKDKGWKILAVEVMPDHIHLFVSVPPSISPSEVVKCFKGQSARKLLVKFPELVHQRDYRASFWAPSYFVASAGDVSSETGIWTGSSTIIARSTTTALHSTVGTTRCTINTYPQISSKCILQRCVSARIRSTGVNLVLSLFRM